MTTYEIKIGRLGLILMVVYLANTGMNITSRATKFNNDAAAGLTPIVFVALLVAFLYFNVKPVKE